MQCSARHYRMVEIINGNYKVTGNWYSGILVNGSKGVMKDPTYSGREIDIKFGDFGEADPEIVKATGQKYYNLQLTYTARGMEVNEPGVISKDGLNITLKGVMGTCELEWITEEEAAALEADGDPIEAPPGDYKIQPEYQGKLLWITGTPGLGKSTSAQLLSRNHGYVYYEADCFGGIKNPYIPREAENPSMAQFNQRSLKGKGLEKRMKICKHRNNAFMRLVEGEDLSAEENEKFYEFYSCMCEDILSERQRIGGDWAIAAVAFTRALRDHIRYELYEESGKYKYSQG